ncbi:MAG TPA: peptide deformylase [Thermotogota bacterium]|nr:peptide deformylase [Thermotogota bacterium]HPJ88382.1 peptide deformylase [Thermotogota bacterium]HPR95450.1 peptide deformylase [Thermotogota bacterium]
MEYKLRYYGDPILRKKTEKITDFGEELQKLIEDMVRLMYAEDGAGLAGPQVGVSKSLFVGDDNSGDGWKAYINPEILDFSDEKEVAEEGCLSVPDIFENVERAKEVRIRYNDPEGNVHEETLSSYKARIVQHETDHLNGILFIDHLSTLKRRLLKKKLDFIKRMAKENTNE